MSGRNKFRPPPPPPAPCQFNLNDWKKIDFLSKPIESDEYESIIFIVLSDSC